MSKPAAYLVASRLCWEDGLWARGPAHPAVEAALSRLALLRSEWKDHGCTHPPAWRGVLLEMLKEARDA